MLKEMDDSVPIVFAAELEDGNKGTFKYNIKTGECEKFQTIYFRNYPIVMIMKRLLV